MNKTQNQIVQVKEEKKGKNCYNCGQEVFFQHGKYSRNATGKWTPTRFNKDGSVHVCSKKQQSSSQQKENEKKSYKDNNNSRYSDYVRWLRWFWGFGPGAKYRNYKGEDYDQRRREAWNERKQYKQQYYRTDLTKEAAITALELSVETLKLPYKEFLQAIKTAYRKCALRYHPDRNKEAGAVEKFRAATEAYELFCK